MKKLFTLGALGLLASFGAQAQITLDGRIQANEKGATVGQYQSLGTFDNARGFGDWGLKEAFVGEDANFIYVAINGTVEGNGNSFQIFFDVPSRTGIAACTALPAAPSATGDPTSFASMTAVMEMPTDAGVAFRYNATVPQLELADYTLPTPASQILGTMDDQGTAGTFLSGVAKAAYKTTTDGKVTSNTDEGLEFAFAKAAYGITSGTAIKIFVLQNNGDGGFLSSDYIPDNPTLTTADPAANLGAGPDFCLDVPGTQFNTYTAGAVFNGLPKLNEVAINFSVSPNPIEGQEAAVAFTVPNRDEVVSLVVSDLLGRPVSVLANGKLPMGEQRFSLKTAGLSAGQYIVKLMMGDKVATRKVSVL